jgi:DHA1 family bicyclomycin/chloramphenicol resistance-like MFS transporter
VNIQLLKRYESGKILQGALVGQTLVGLTFLGFALAGWLGLPGVLFFLFAFLACAGMVNPNAGALALAPFGKHAGSAAALMGFIQITAGSLASALVGFFNSQSLLPTVVILSATATMGCGILWFGRRKKS